MNGAIFMHNVFYLPIIAVVSFCAGFLLVSIPGIKNAFKKSVKRFSDKEMESAAKKHEYDFASSNEEYSRTPTHLS